MRDGLRSSVVLNAANELAVEAFLAGDIPFQGIAGAVEKLLSQADDTGNASITSLDDVFAVDAWARRSFAATFSS